PPKIIFRNRMKLWQIKSEQPDQRVRRCLNTIAIFLIIRSGGRIDGNLFKKVQVSLLTDILHKFDIDHQSSLRGRNPEATPGQSRSPFTDKTPSTMHASGGLAACRNKLREDNASRASAFVKCG